MSPRFSIVIPCYNYGRFLRRAVDSALAQQGPSFEVLVVDDASTDDTPQVAASYGSRIRYHRNDRRGGPVLAGRYGFYHTTGEYLLFLDADDRLRDGYLTAMERALTLRPQARLAFGQIVDVRRDGSQRRQPLPRLHEQTLANFADYIRGRLRLPAGGAVLHRDVFERFKPLTADQCKSHGVDRVFIGQGLANFPATVAPDAEIELHDHDARMRHDVDSACAAGLAAMKLLFTPQMLPPEALELADVFAAQLRLEHGWLLYRRGRYAEARDAYRAAWRHQPSQVRRPRHLRRLATSAIAAMMAPRPAARPEGKTP